MKDDYIKNVRRKLKFSNKRKKEIIEDLNEIFATAQENGETEEMVIKRLGTPSSFVKECEDNLADEIADRKAKLWKCAWSVILLIMAVICMIPYLSIHGRRYPPDAIGHADAATMIYIWEESTFVNENTLFGIGVILLIVTGVLIFKIFKNKKR